MCLTGSHDFFKKIHIYKKSFIDVFEASINELNMFKDISAPMRAFAVSERAFNANFHEKLLYFIRISEQVQGRTRRIHSVLLSAV